MPTTIYLSVRGDGSWRVIEAFRHALGADGATLVVHPNRDESGFYGSADVGDPAAAREAFARARQPYPQLKAHLSAPAPERDEPRQSTGARPDGTTRRATAVGREPREPRGQHGAHARQTPPTEHGDAVRARPEHEDGRSRRAHRRGNRHRHAQQ